MSWSIDPFGSWSADWTEDLSVWLVCQFVGFQMHDWLTNERNNIFCSQHVPPTTSKGWHLSKVDSGLRVWQKNMGSSAPPWVPGIIYGCFGIIPASQQVRSNFVIISANINNVVLVLDNIYVEYIRFYIFVCYILTVIVCVNMWWCWVILSCLRQTEFHKRDW